MWKNERKIIDKHLNKFLQASFLNVNHYEKRRHKRDKKKHVGKADVSSVEYVYYVSNNLICDSDGQFYLSVKICITPVKTLYAVSASVKSAMARTDFLKKNKHEIIVDYNVFPYRNMNLKVLLS